MQDKISSSQFQALFSELTGDQAVADNTISKNKDDQIKLLLKRADESIIHDFRINKARKSCFDEFLSVTENKLETLQAAAVNDRQHSKHSADGDVIVNMAPALSSRDLYDQCKEEVIKSGVKNENIPSYSWFRFQFWPKNPYTHHALN